MVGPIRHQVLWEERRLWEDWKRTCCCFAKSSKWHWLVDWLDYCRKDWDFTGINIHVDTWCHKLIYTWPVTELMYQACYRADVIDCALSRLLQPVFTHCDRSVANISVSFCYIRLIQHWQIDRLLQSDSISSEQPFAASGLIQLWYRSYIRPEAATALWRFCMCMLSWCHLLMDNNISSL